MFQDAMVGDRRNLEVLREVVKGEFNGWGESRSIWRREA
jgi:hypothetical protein